MLSQGFSLFHGWDAEIHNGGVKKLELLWTAAGFRGVI
jgi:hypothetical protein